MMTADEGFLIEGRAASASAESNHLVAHILFETASRLYTLAATEESDARGARDFKAKMLRTRAKDCYQWSRDSYDLDHEEEA
jgi:hypothetical protein